jgi:hypothetical protein
MANNEMYLVVLPQIHLNSGLAEQILTVLPNRDFATEFFGEEVDGYLLMFQNRTKYFSGGHVKGYTFEKEAVGDEGRVIVKVIQNVE